MAVDVQQYCGVKIAATGGFEAVTCASAVEANWNTSAELWDDGDNQWIFWGLTSGELTLFELELDPVDPPQTITVIADYTTTYTITITYGMPTPQNIVVFTDCCYYFGTEAKRLKPMGELFILEGGFVYKILKEN